MESESAGISFSEREIKERKEKLVRFLKKKKDWVVYLALALITFLGVFIRTRNIPKLKDITTNDWTLGPDLDPFLFLRWAENIVENGRLFLIDTMRYVPLARICSGAACDAISTANEMKLLPYMIAGFHNILAIFSEVSITYSAIIFPVAMFALTTIAFFLFARKIFYKEDEFTRNIIALVSSLIFVLVPSLLPRTIAGIPEKESAAFFFLFMAFYFFLEAFTSEKLKRGVIFSILSGVTTGLLALIWGGVTFVFMTIAGAVLFSFILGKINKQNFYLFGIWITGFVAVMMPFSLRYSLTSLLGSISTALVFAVFLILLIDFLLFGKKFIKVPERITKKIPPRVFSLLVAGIFLVLISSVFFGISFIPSQIGDVINHAVHPLVQSRFGVTVAENRQPYFTDEWKNYFGPLISNIPVYFWLFFVGSIFLFYAMIKKLRKKEKLILTLTYFIFLISLIFSKYSSQSRLDGNNGLSLFVYFGGAILFLASFSYLYYKRHKKSELGVFSEFDFSLLLYFIILTMTVIGARGAIRLIMVLGAVSPIAIGFLLISVTKKAVKEREDSKKFLIAAIALAIIMLAIFMLWTYYNQDKLTSENYAPGIYQWQWQKAMGWVRDNTPKEAVFAHWWDYGYWVQSIGKRATILDGGNSVGYWNYFMGRNVLTGTNEKDALEFLYAHNATNLLIDSTDIGKYSAFSSIGSNENYDRYSWIMTFLMDETQVHETENETDYLYRGNSPLDEDLVWKEEGTEVFLPRRSAVVAAFILKTDAEGKLLQPSAIIVYNQHQYSVPLRYVYTDGKLKDFNSGANFGIFLFPTIKPDAGQINKIGAALFLSNKTVHSELVRLYLFNEPSDHFKLAHTEPDLLINSIKASGADVGDFVYYASGENSFRGPIKIWEVSYPADITFNSEYLDTNYPEKLNSVIPGEYN
jgi:asparagine N-glycosylation enzyme membrane subunit Stt3